MNKDTLTTIVGAVVAAGTAATPVMSAVDGTFDKTDWAKLVTAVFMAIFGYFTNKPNTTQN